MPGAQALDLRRIGWRASWPEDRQLIDGDQVQQQ
jgi:hypothetical protein